MIPAEGAYRLLGERLDDRWYTAGLFSVETAEVG